MARRLKPGITLLDEKEGDGRAADRGDDVVFNLRLFMHHGDEVPLNQVQSERLPGQPTREIDGQRLLDRTVTLGQREVIAAVEYTLLGMKPGGYRRVRASPHPAYRERGLSGLIPGYAVLIVEIWLQAFAEGPPRYRAGGKT
jgi:hypothetical protein